jgi:hypothetical protein
MAALRLAPLFALPVLGGVLVAFVIATFEDDAELDPQAASTADEELEPQPETAVEDSTPQPTEVPETAVEVPPPEPSPLDDFDLGELFNLDDFSEYWRGSLPPALADLFEHGFGGQPSQR